MTHPLVSGSEPLLKQKLESLAVSIVTTQVHLSDHLIALLEPDRLVVLWKLKTALEKIQRLLDRTLSQPCLTINDSMLDLVQSTEAILADIESRLQLFEAQEIE